ncbi:MAG: B12-binding domain-containing radical SAM protein, partial [Promethearchaeota archaeon]
LYEMDRPRFSLNIDDNSFIKELHPSLLVSIEKRLRKDILKLFFNSIDKLENLDEYIEYYLKNTKEFKKFLLKFGMRLEKPLQKWISKDNLKEIYKKKLRVLLKNIKEQEAKSSLKIQFIRLTEHSGTLTYPMGIMYLSAKLKESLFTNISYLEVKWIEKLKEAKERWEERAKEGFSINESFDFSHFNKDYDALEKQQDELISKRAADIIFIGPITTNYLPFLIDFVPRVRKLTPNSLIFAGGPHFGFDSLMDQELLDNYCQALDGLIIGEAEHTVIEICELYYSQLIKFKRKPESSEFKNIIANVKGLFFNVDQYRKRDLLDERELINLPFPDYELLLEYLDQVNQYPSIYSLAERRNPIISIVDGIIGEGDNWGYYEDYIKLFDGYFNEHAKIPYAIIIGSRDCPYQCSFCASHNNPRRLRPAKNIFEEIQFLHDHLDMKLFIFFDPLFTTFSKKEIDRIKELCTLIIESRMDIKYTIEIRADVINKLPEDLLVIMIKSGCAEFNLGIEKGSNKALNRFQKSMTIEEHEIAIDKLRNACFRARNLNEKLDFPEILINGTLILGGPNENKDDIKDTLIHGFKLELDGVKFFPLEIHPGTRLYKQALQENIIEPGIKPYLDYYNYPIYETKVLHKDYLFKVQEYADKVINAKYRIRQELSRFKNQLKYSGEENDNLDNYLSLVESQFKDYINNVLDLIKQI